jgi:hypothetical protein
MTPEKTGLFRYIWIIGNDHATFDRGYIFCSVQRVTSCTEGSNRPTFVRGTMSLAGIFDNDKVMFFGNFNNRIHVARLTVQMDRDDSPGMLRDPFFYF